MSDPRGTARPKARQRWRQRLPARVDLCLDRGNRGLVGLRREEVGNRTWIKILVAGPAGTCLPDRHDPGVGSKLG